MNRLQTIYFLHTDVLIKFRIKLIKLQVGCQSQLQHLKQKLAVQSLWDMQQEGQLALLHQSD
ncbi:MAG: hypothetical protein CMM80_04705 [Rhodospirillaceae bacterium]|nr:hypothetical protein [Rhodospirillaceae bacterium]